MPRKHPRSNYPLDLGPPDLFRREKWTRAAEHDGHESLAGWIREVCDLRAEEVDSRTDSNLESHDRYMSPVEEDLDDIWADD